MSRRKSSAAKASKETAPESSSRMKAASPAEVLRDAKARMAETAKVEIPRMPTGRHPASDAAKEMGRAHKTVEDIRISLTLKDVLQCHQRSNRSR